MFFSDKVSISLLAFTITQVHNNLGFRTLNLAGRQVETRKTIPDPKSYVPCPKNLSLQRCPQGLHDDNPPSPEDQIQGDVLVMKVNL